MPDQVTRDNESARKRARSAGRLTYQHEVIDSWPACVECGTPIRHRPGERGMYRRCGCPDVRWSCLSGGWRRIEPKEATNDAR